MKSALLLFLVTLMCSQWATGQGVTSRLTPDEMQKVHSRLFHKGPVGQIPEMLSKTTGPVNVPCVVGVVQKVMVSPVDELSMLAADSDLVVLGKAGAGTAHMTADKDFLYTDWNFTVEEVLKNNATSPVETGATILVTRPGGKLQVNGRMVQANCADFLDFSTGREYLLYLRFVPETGAYTIGGGSGAFEVALALYDDPTNGGNGDGVIDQRDAVFNSLRLWIDANHDGISQPDELYRLPSLGVNSISLKYRADRRTDQYGNVFRYRAQVNSGDATNTGRMAYDVFFVGVAPSSAKNIIPVRGSKCQAPPIETGMLATALGSR